MFTAFSDMVPTERKPSSTASASLISSSAPASRLVSSSDRSSALVSAYVPEFTSIESSNCTSATGASTTASDCKPLSDYPIKIFSHAARSLRDCSVSQGLKHLAKTCSSAGINILLKICDSGEAICMVGATSRSAWDSRIFWVSPFDGTPSDWLRFEGDLFNRLAREYQAGDASDLYSLLDTLEGSDTYGAVSQADPNLARPIPPVNAADTKDWNRHIRRNRMLASILITHITDDNLKRMIQAAHPRDGYEAWLLLKTNCYREPNDLALQEMDKMWNDCNFTSVGIDENSINNMIRFLHHLNSRRPAAKQYDEDQIVVKLLGCFSPAICESIAHDAMRELAATPDERRFVRPALPGAPAGSRSTQKLLELMEPLWRMTFQKGGIKGGRRGHAADGALRVDAAPDDDDDTAFFTRGGHGGGGRRPQLRTALPPAEIAARNLPRCFRCQGIGHVASDCGNSADTIISIADAQAMLAQQQQQRRPAAIVGRPPARPAASRRPTPATAFRRDRALLVDGNPVGGADDAAGDAALACVDDDEVQILGEDDACEEPFADDAAFTALSLN